jgi:DNA primase
LQPRLQAGLRAHAQARFGQTKFTRLRWVVESVEPTDRVEGVYCATVEGTHAFALAGNILTGNCFTCGEAGDALDWLEKMEGEGFVEAFRRLAALANVSLPEPEESPEAKAQRERQGRITDLLRRAGQFYVASLTAPEGAKALHYLTGRGLDEETMARWGLGYAPQGHAVRGLLAEWGFTQAEGLAAGLLAQRDDGAVRDRFWHRIIFPLHDRAARLVGFAGRAMGADVKPKYLNSPQTEMFNKRQLLYGLAQARAAIRRTGEVVVVEGYMDAIAAHSAGHQNVVAQMGTMITDEQLAILGQQAQRVILGLDTDRAGALATDRAAGKLIKAGMLDALVLDLPDGKDPDEFIRGGGDWGAAVKAAKPLPTHMIAAAAAEVDHERPREVSGAIRMLLGVLAAVSDPLARDHYEAQIARAFGVERAMIDRLAGRKGDRPPVQPPGVGPGLIPDLPAVDREPYLLGLYLAYREVPPALDWDIDPADFTDPALRALFVATAPLAILGEGPGAVIDATGDPEVKQRAESIIIDTWDRHGPEYPCAVQEALAILGVLRAERQRRDVRELADLIRDAAAAGDHPAVRDLSARLRALTVR